MAGWHPRFDHRDLWNIPLFLQAFAAFLFSRLWIYPADRCGFIYTACIEVFLISFSKDLNELGQDYVLSQLIIRIAFQTTSGQVNCL